MAPSLTEIAETLDSWAASDSAVIMESDAILAVANLDAEKARTLALWLGDMGWAYKLEDASVSSVLVGDIHVDLAPYRLVADKPKAADNSTFILTSMGLEEWLARPPSTPVLHLARLAAPFDTLAIRFAPVGGDTDFLPVTLKVDPRRLVREAVEVRTVARDLALWLLRDADAVPWSDTVFQVWARKAASVLVRALSSEIEEGGVLVFRGPPITRLEEKGDLANKLGLAGFLDLQKAASWVYENEREAENRHGLYAAEMARTAKAGPNVADVFKVAARAALEGARIAYQLGVSQLSRDSLKALADLRKAISDESAKLSDATRQLASAVAGALFGGVTLVAAKLSVGINSDAIATATIILGILLVIYVCAVVWNGYQFVRLQRDLREQWRDKLYRFIPDDDYAQMVTQPANKAETAFRWAAIVSILLAVALLLTVIFVSGGTHGADKSASSSLATKSNDTGLAQDQLRKNLWMIRQRVCVDWRQQSVAGYPFAPFPLTCGDQFPQNSPNLE